MDTPTKSTRGFANPNYDPKRQREVASMGGKAAHASGNAHEWNSETAREAGKKGGRNRQKFE
jgi:general stress protein YciG